MNINKIGNALYGENWRAPLAKDLDINERTMRRYADGELEANPKLIPELINLVDQNIQSLMECKAMLINEKYKALAKKKIPDGSFAEACYNQNTLEDLQNINVADQTDMQTWGLTESEYFENIDLALAHLITDKHD